MIIFNMPKTKSHKIELPDKLYFKVGEVSSIVNVPAYVLRFWETQFPRINPKRTTTGQRLYRKNDVELILTIKKLLYEDKFTIEGARKYLNSNVVETNATSLKDSLKEIYEELKKIRNMLNET